MAGQSTQAEGGGLPTPLLPSFNSKEGDNPNPKVKAGKLLLVDYSIYMLFFNR